MKCPVCERNLAPTLSICPSCGAMMNDTVREELQSKIARSIPLPKRLPKIEQNVSMASQREPSKTMESVRKAPSPRPVDTAGLASPKTSPTLVEFQNKNTVLPEWRIQMQNAVRQRMGQAVNGSSQHRDDSAGISRQPLNGAKPVRAGTTGVAENQPTLENADPRLTAALSRLAESRRNFLPGGDEIKSEGSVKMRPANGFPFDVVRSAPNSNVRLSDVSERTVVRPKPAMVAPMRMETRLNTNKLPRIQEIIPDEIEESVEITRATYEESEIAPPVSSMFRSDVIEVNRTEVNRIVISAEKHAVADEEEVVDDIEDDIEDLALYSMRFNAGLFDLIVAIFGSMLLLSPLALAGGDWFSTSGMITFAATLAIVLFVYMTTCVGFLGKTLGMHLSSLVLVDANENDYPTIHQAAVSSSIYILSLATCGLGFVTVFFNEEKRAAHDLLSGTIIVREF